MKLTPGYWRACTTSGGAGSGYQAQTACQTFTIKTPQHVRLSAIAGAAGRHSVTLSAGASAVGRRARIVLRYAAQSCEPAAIDAVLLCAYDRLVHTASSTITLRATQRLGISERWWTLGPSLQVTVTTSAYATVAAPVAAGLAERSYCAIRSCTPPATP